MRELGKLGLLLCALVVALWAGDILVDRTALVSVVADTPLYSLPPQDHPADLAQRIRRIATPHPSKSGSRSAVRAI